MSIAVLCVERAGRRSHTILMAESSEKVIDTGILRFYVPKTDVLTWR